MQYEIRTPNGYVFESQRNTGVAWKLTSGTGQVWAHPGDAVRDLDQLRERGYMCEVVPVESHDAS